jgi:hypothetical protein
VNNLDLQKVGKAFGFKVPPKVHINIGASGKDLRRGGNHKESNNVDHIAKQRNNVLKKNKNKQWSR